MYKYFIYTIIHISLFVLFIDYYYEYILTYLLIPISKQNNYYQLNYNIYNNYENILFYNKNLVNHYPIFEINFNLNNITLILYYLVFIYILLYIIPLLLLQIHIFIKNSLFRHENKKILFFLLSYFILFILIFVIHNNINLFFIIQILFNTYQQINIYIFDLNFNLYEYIYLYIFVFTICYIWIHFIIVYFMININNKKIILLFILITISISPPNIYIYILEIIYFVSTYIIVHYVILINYYIKRIPLENK
jgi:hypothetical protein